jgi:hypothetical protein
MQFVIWISAAILLLIFATYIVDFVIKAPAFKGSPADNFNGKTFRNLDGVKARGFSDIAKWALTGDPGIWMPLSEEDAEYGTLDHSRIHSDEAHITFVNHATFLIQVEGLNILTDPIWSLRASPF